MSLTLFVFVLAGVVSSAGLRYQTAVVVKKREGGDMDGRPYFLSAACLGTKRWKGGCLLSVMTKGSTMTISRVFLWLAFAWSVGLQWVALASGKFDDQITVLSCVAIMYGAGVFGR